MNRRFIAVTTTDRCVYFHDGSAQTLEDVFRTGTVHNVFEQLSVEELGLLIDYMKALSLDD